MFWQEDLNEEDFKVPKRVQDTVFGIDCKVLPTDHAHLLGLALIEKLPWLEKAGGGVFAIGRRSSGNGWTRNKKEDGIFYPAKRSKLVIRLPSEKIEAAHALVGETINLGKYPLKITRAYPPRLLSDMHILFARHIHFDNAPLDEEDFLERVFEALKKLDIHPKKMMAGRKKILKTKNGVIHTQALMVANLQKDESVRLQEKGIGKHSLFGCGLFVPQKDIKAVGETYNKR